MSEDKLSFHHIHMISEDPHAAAKWYEDILGATIRGEIELRSAADHGRSRRHDDPDPGEASR